MFSIGVSLLAMLATTAFSLAEAAEAVGPGITRNKAYYWIRAVTPPSRLK